MLQSHRGPQAIRSILGKLPLGLEGTYKTAMQRIQDKGNPDYRTATSIFSWILCRKEPDALSVKLVQHAVALMTNEHELPDKVDLLDVCEGLVVVEELPHSKWRIMRFVRTSACFIEIRATSSNHVPILHRQFSKRILREEPSALSPKRSARNRADVPSMYEGLYTTAGLLLAFSRLL